MSFGPSAMRFEVKHGVKGGIFWQKEPSKQKPRKFGYKSKGLRHPVRRVEPEYIEEPAQKAKPSTDFIRKNREQFGQNQREEEKENYHGSSSAGRPSSEIKPGTVTLTQDQLNALLATVGKFKPGEADGLRISIDADSNQLKIDSPQLNSRGMDNGHGRNGDHEERSIPGLNGVADNDDRVEAKNRRNAEKGVRFDSARNEVQHMKLEPQQTPLPPAPLVPWKHMTVAERKRLQWAREKAAEEAVGTFDPWGRPGAGAPPKKQEPHPPETQLHTTEDKHLRKAIDDIEAKYSALLAQTATRESPAVKISPHQEDDRRSYPRATNDDADVRVSQDSHLHMEDRGNARPSKKQSRTDELKERKGGQKKGDRRRAPSREEEKGGNREERGQGERRKERDEREFMGMKTETAEIVTRGNVGLPASMQTSMLIGQVAPDNSQYLSKKEEEKKRWIEELDRQREEKRLQKQRERDAQRAGGDDSWADRFVQEPPPRPSIRMQAQQPTSTQQLLAPDAPASAPAPAPRSAPAPAPAPPPYSVGQAYGYEARRNESSLSRARTDSQNQEMPPAAMRSSMMIGAIAPNDDRIRSKKEEEKKMWLDELNKQREEQREARMKLKDRQRASEETWADRFTQDPRTAAAAGVSSHQVPGLETQPPAGYYDNATGRVNSAPQPQPTSKTSAVEDEQATFIRGQNVYMDPVTRNELEQKRRTHLEYQAAVKAQIEEKERLKREERESKWRDEMEEEAKLRAERDQLQRQQEAEENKHKQREEARQKQVEHLKHMMDAEQERAKEERMINRLKTLQQAGHDVRGLKAHYETTTPRIHGVSVDPVSIPDLGGTSPRDNYYPNPPSYRAGTRNQEISTGPINHDPYKENRVLTPSRLRKPSQPHSDPLSPRREFATQTADDIAALIEGLKKQISDVEIEYRAKPGDRPTNNSKAGQRPPAPKKPGDNRQRQAAPPADKPTRQKQQQKADGKPPKWNYQNPKKKAPVKQSEKDPFYEQKRQESEDRRARRERQLQYLVELNKQVIPTKKHSRLDLHPADGAGDGDVPKGYHSERVEAEASPRRKRERDGPSHNERRVEKGGRSRSPPARNDGKFRREQVETDRIQNDRSQSPPVPAVRHKVGMNPAKDFESNYDVDAHNYSNYNGNQEATPHVDEHGNVRAPVRDTDFVPIMRTQDILDPSRADEPVQLSRENTHIKIARQHYHENLRPADYGNQLQMYEDRQRQPVPRSKDPILNPGLVKDFPTARQDQILQQLSSLKQSLIQRQRELETCMSPSDLEKQL